MQYLTRRVRVLFTSAVVALIFSYGVSRAQTVSCDPQNGSPDGCFESRYDRFEDVTTVSLSWMRVVNEESPLYLSFLSFYEGKNPRPPQSNRIALMSVSPAGYKYRTDCDLVFLIDDQRFHYSTKNLSNNSGQGKWAQSFAIVVDEQLLRKIAWGHSVEGRFCNQQEFRLTANQRIQLQTYIYRFWDSVK